VWILNEIGGWMAGFKFGLKIYDFDWYVQHGLSELEAAKLLRDWQVDFVMLPNRYLPMPDSAVDSVMDEASAKRFC
jgi:hypothetical protein